MKRHALALLVHPYKNILVGEDAFRSAINGFCRKFLEIATAYQNVPLNLVLPAHMLNNADPLLLSSLREVQKRDRLEWLSPGYTEPFLSFSPQWLTGANIRSGMDTFGELLASKPSGYAPPFSNWEPSCIDTLRDCGIQYVVLSRAVLPLEAQDYCGYWMTEQNGSTMVVFPAHVLHHFSAPANIQDWIEGALRRDPSDESVTKLVTIEYLIPLISEESLDPYQWLWSLVKALDGLLLRYQAIRLGEFTALAQPLGLQYIQPQLAITRSEDTTIPFFSNYLHTFEQVGIIQRKMMDIADTLAPIRAQKDVAGFIKQLFFIQDINRFLPAKSGGFTQVRDRLWTYAKMIDIETQLHGREGARGGQVRIADILRNGTKSIVLSNRSIAAYIDHKNGGNIYELDFRDRLANCCACYNAQTHTPPRILVAGKSCASFVDHFLDKDCQRADFLDRSAAQRDDFPRAPFEYKIKKTTTGVKAILARQGVVTVDAKSYPLSIEKVFGLEGDASALSFAYQLSNHTLTSYAFRFAVEFAFALPGAETNEASISCGQQTLSELTSHTATFQNATKLALYDEFLGMSVQFVLQKPVEVWVFPSARPSVADTTYQGTTIVLSSPVALGENGAWSLIGKITFRKLKLKGPVFDAV
jgi:4-alpha-glucanotransferase